MKISYNWLCNYLNVEVPPDKVAEMLTGCGLEIESQEPYCPVKGGLKGVVIGEVLTCMKHPNSDHLSLTTVDVGSGEPLKIVCGAPNVAAGQKVAVATVGTTLYFNEKAITLQKTKIRGEISEGMICAEDELGLGSSHAGILVLDNSAKTGTPAAGFFNIETDTVFTIGLTPNRIDAASHVGVARDLVAVINNFGGDATIKNQSATLILPDVSSFKPDNLKRVIGVEVEDPVACPRYTALTISGIRVKESPAWLRNRLEAVGLRPINNIVDITNFILMELGQPLHAFDCDQISGGKVVVRKYPQDTLFVTLDNVERKLSSADLMISNEIDPMCLAGVFGGIRSGVTEQTTSVFIESACFDPGHIRKTSRGHGLQTDASFRFERGADIHITEYALKRAALLIKEIAGGEISSEIIDVYPLPRNPVMVDLHFDHCDLLIGKKIPRELIRSILLDLGIKIESTLPLIPSTDNPHRNQGSIDHGEGNVPLNEVSGLRLAIPVSKVDVTREADVIEEIIRIYSYNNIEIEETLHTSLSRTATNDPEKIQNRISDYLSANGFYEIMTNSLTKSAYYSKFGEHLQNRSVRMLNPLSRDLDMMRQTLLFGLLETVVYNQNRKIPDLKLYEFGKVYRLDPSGENPVKGYHEERRLALLMTGRKEPESWNSGNERCDFFDLKNMVANLFKMLAIHKSRIGTAPLSSSFISTGLKYSFGQSEAGIMGSISGLYLKEFDIVQPVYYAELNWDLLRSIIPAQQARYQELPKFPEVRRDLALLLDQGITFNDIERVAFQTETKLLRKVGLFDVYEGENLGRGKKSYAIAFILRDEAHTLTENEIEKTMERLIKAFSNQLNARIR